MPTRRQLLRGTLAAATAAFALDAAPRAAAARAGAARLASLAADLDGQLVLPSAPAYAEARQMFQPRYDAAAPAAIAYPLHADDVATCLTYARDRQLSVVVRGGSHSYAGWSTRTGALVLDLSALSDCVVSDANAQLGAGARLSDVNLALATAGVAVPVGLCPTLSIGGLALGGGLGVTSRAWGTTSDNLQRAEVVTVDGRVRDTDASNDPDLFWALRGGGGSFAVATRLWLAARPAPDCAHAELHWSWSDAAALLRAWQAWAPKLPDPLWSQVEFDVSGDPPDPYVGITCLTGLEDLGHHLDDLARLAGTAPLDSYTVVRSYADTMRKLSGCLGQTPAQCHLPGTLPGHDPAGQVTRENYAARSDFITTALPDAAISAILDAVAAYAAATPPGGRGVVQFDAVCGGAVNRVSPEATAFVHRDGLFLAQYLAFWPTGAPADEVGQHLGWLDRLWNALRPFAGGQAYQNYADPRLDDWRHAYYGANLPRLQEVKSFYDPHRVLDFPQAL